MKATTINNAKRISENKIKSLLKSHYNSGFKAFWNTVFVYDGNCYVTNGFQMTKFAAYLLDFESLEKIEYVYVEDLPAADENRVINMINQFEEIVKGVNYSRINEFDRFWLNKKNYKITISNFKKEYDKIGYHGMIERSTPLTFKFGKREEDYKTVVNTKYLQDLLYLHKNAEIPVFIQKEQYLKPIIVGNYTDNIISILMPMRSGCITKQVFYNEV